jgi:hypothetical protein
MLYITTIIGTLVVLWTWWGAKAKRGRVADAFSTRDYSCGGEIEPKH